ncbi:MAG: Txe/YoeB family addiction module toxin [Chitinivibrionia bacterium]|nr:Txe/YoeB family addiction module toxin [Chitinivibrionia bacterium]
MIYDLFIPDDIKQQIREYKKAGNLSAYKKIAGFLLELERHPRSGTGKPERLKYKKGEVWSRRINHEHRLVYSIMDEIITVEIISAKGHYE